MFFKIPAYLIQYIALTNAVVVTEVNIEKEILINTFTLNVEAKESSIVLIVRNDSPANIN